MVIYDLPVAVKKPRKRTTGIESAYLAQHRAMLSKALNLNDINLTYFSCY